MLKYLSVRKSSEHGDISAYCIKFLGDEGHVLGAIWINYSWAMPDDEPRPKDMRIKSRKIYIQKL